MKQAHKVIYYIISLLKIRYTQRNKYTAVCLGLREKKNNSFNGLGVLSGNKEIFRTIQRRRCKTYECNIFCKNTLKYLRMVIRSSFSHLSKCLVYDLLFIFSTALFVACLCMVIEKSVRNWK